MSLRYKGQEFLNNPNSDYASAVRRFRRNQKSVANIATDFSRANSVRCYLLLIKVRTDSGDKPRTLISKGKPGTRFDLRILSSSL